MNVIKKTFLEKLKLFLENSKNKSYNKNFVINIEYKNFIPKTYKLKYIKYEDLPEYIKKEPLLRETIIIEDIDEKFSIKNKYINNIIFYKIFENFDINKNFILITEKNLYNLSVNSIIFT